MKRAGAVEIRLGRTHLYGDGHTFNLKNAGVSGFAVNLVIPYKEMVNGLRMSNDLETGELK